MLWPLPTGSQHFRREPSPEVGPVGQALLALAFRSTLQSPVLFPTFNILVILLVIAWTWTVPTMVTVCCIFTALNWNSTRPATFEASTPFSPSSSTPTVPPTPMLQRQFLGLFFTAVWCTSASSLVTFLLMKPSQFLTLNNFIVPKTFLAITLLSLWKGADVRPPSHHLPAWWFSASRFMVVVVAVPGVGGHCCCSSPGCDGK